MLAVTRSPYQRLMAAMADPAGAQLRVLRGILRAQRDSPPGRRFGFAEIRNAGDYRRRVPVHRYSDLQPEIQSMLEGEPNRLVSQPVICYERTGGSTGGAKIIPYTAAALGAFHAAIHPWLHDLARNRPGLTSGRAYWAISPAGRAPEWSADGTPIGLDSDVAYFGPALAPHLAALSVAEPDLARSADLESWRYLTLLRLVAAEDLSLISVWSPTFLLLLLQGLVQHGPALVRDLADGSLSLPGSPSRPDAAAPDRGRADRVERALDGSEPDTLRLWPRLDTLSCWTSGAAAWFLPQLRRAFPAAWIQGKGLLATEGVVTLPLVGLEHPVLALHSGFFEFLDERDHSRLAWELEPDAEYRVLITTPGGLYRYALEDRVRVRGRLLATPLLEFIGRAGAVSDLCGEKLDEPLVRAALPDAVGFALLAPALARGAHYVLFMDEREQTAETAQELAAELDRRLRSNPQYDYARRLGQLGEIRPRRLSRALERYLGALRRGGQRLGDIKPALLRNETDWEQRLGEAGQQSYGSCQ